MKDLDLAIIDAGHITPENIVELCVANKSGVIVCTHKYFDLDEEQLNIDAKEKGFEGKIIVGRDLMEFDLDSLQQI